MRYTSLFSIPLLIFFTACNKDKFSTTPSLKYESENTRVVQSGQQLRFTLSFTDAEGDLTDSLILNKEVGNCPASSGVQLYPLPLFPTTKNQKGEIVVTLFYNVGGINTIGSPQCQPQNDTVVYKFVLKDKAQHYSDTASSPSIVIIHQ
ncbi:MAG: hypothetical protein ABI416_15220 [Ginsengibacter sp.]